MDIRNATVDTPLGDMRLVVAAGAVTGLYFPGHWHLPPPEAFGETITEEAARQDQVFASAITELHEYLAGGRREFRIPIATAGDSFSEQVWALLREIPYGETTTYGELATRLGNPRLAQRVGQCVGRNPVSIFIPCHRVVGADGSLTGYAGGLERKQRLLELEEPAERTAARLF